jgi:hypothetical protein
MYHVLEMARKGCVCCSCKRNVLWSVSGAPARATSMYLWSDLRYSTQEVCACRSGSNRTDSWAELGKQAR